jgi:hypothetical protein
VDPDPRDHGAGSRPALICSSFQDDNKNSKFFLLITVNYCRYISFRKQQVIKKSQTLKNQSFSIKHFLLKDGSRSVQIITNPDPGGSKTFTTTDSEYWPILSAMIETEGTFQSSHSLILNYNCTLTVRFLCLFSLRIINL